MAEIPDTGNTTSALAGAFTWKNFGLGAASLCVLLAGAVARNWDTNSSATSATSAKQWERLGELRDEIRTVKSDLLRVEERQARIKEQTLDQEVRIRENEKRLNQGRTH